MDTVFAHAVGQITQMPLEAQPEVGQALLGRAAEAELPVIEFGEQGAAAVE